MLTAHQVLFLLLSAGGAETGATITEAWSAFPRATEAVGGVRIHIKVVVALRS